ncbi:MAG: CPBP family intramembrane glutamic endopeptidase [Gemmatimonadota bacterium]
MIHPRENAAREVGLFAGLWLILLLPFGWLDARLQEAISPGLVLPWGLAVLLAALAAAWLLLRREERGLETMGLPLEGAPALRGMGGGLLAGVALTLPAGLFVGLPGVGSYELLPAGADRVLVEGGRLFLLLSVPAAAEELLFRGYPLALLMEGLGAKWGVGLTSGLFGLLHLANPGLTPLAVVNLFLAGVVLALLVIRTGSLWWAVGAHLGWNWSTWWILGQPVSGLPAGEAPLFSFTAQGPGWLSGGAFGLEGSLAVTVLLLGSGVALYMRGGQWRPSP